MRHALRLAPWLMLLGGCAGSHGFTDAGSDVASSADGRSCASNAECEDHDPCTTDLCLVGGVCSNASTGTCDAGMTCSSAAQCNDRVDCTMDACLVNGTCQHSPNNNLCAPGQMCGSSGCTAACASAADCNDNLDCTVDLCQSNGQCLHTAQNNRCTAPQVCIAGIGCSMASSCGSDAQCDDHLYCTGVERCSGELACVAGTTVNCDDSNPCTVDACSESSMGCTHTMDPACSTNVHSGIYDLAPAPAYSCAFGLYALNVPTLMFAISGGTLTVTGAPATMTSAAPTGTMFAVTGTNPGQAGAGCDEVYSLTGTFSDATHFSGTFSVDFLEPGMTTACDPLFECSMRSFTVTGTGR